MAVDRGTIEKLAELARIQISEANIDDVTTSISEILGLVDQLQAANTDNVAPMAHPLDAVQRLRADQISENNQRDALQACAPEVEDGLFLVPQVID